MAALAVVGALVLTACSGATSTQPPAAPPPGNALAGQLSAAVSADAAWVHLEALQRIADENGGNRAEGTPGYEASVDYVVGVLRTAGFDVETPLYESDRGDELRQVVARTRTGDPESVVLAGAHLDSVTEGPGINDDGSGVAAMLEIATRLGGSPEGLRDTVAFGLWGGEEEGLLGSRSYVRELSRAERDGHRLYLNADMLGSVNGGYYVQGGVGEDEEETGPPGSEEAAEVLYEELSKTGVEPERMALYGDDDYYFAEAGIPTTAAVTGDSEIKTAEQARKWGGQAGEIHDPCYHQACDTLDNVDRTKLDRYTKAIAGTLMRYASGEGGSTG
ncbi:M28 family peptidase [Pseudonocardia nematodicida]|uniref:M28 family peptidase n=1 Tax=Pseudonocardia nematodicida TaxID=1206997 RepID=A0ABV1KDU7_9PSEU